MMGVTMVGDSSFPAFTRDELLAERLAGCTVLGLAAPGIVSLPVRTSYRFMDSGTGVWRAVTLDKVVEADPPHGGQGIFECAIGKTFVTKSEE